MSEIQEIRSLESSEPRLVYFSNEHAAATLARRREGSKEYVFANFHSDDRRLGFGARLLEDVCDYADEHGIVVYLRLRATRPIAEDALNDVQLLMFYRRRGFEIVDDDISIVAMRRQPREKNMPPNERLH